MNWLAKRRAAAKERVRTALRAHREDSGYPLARCAHVSAGRVYLYLAEMEADGEVTSRWQEGPYPRRRLYRLTAPAAAQEER